MVRFLNRLFNIRTHEWPRVLLLFSMAFLSNLGGVLGSTIAYAAFLKQVGVELLPWIMVAGAVLSILASAVYSAFVDRFDHGRLLMVLYGLGVGNVVLGLALLWLGYPTIAYPLLYLFFLTLLAVINPHFITYVNSFYDIQVAKRVLPVVTAGFRVGGVVVVLVKQLFPPRYDRNVMLVIWLLTYLMIVALVWLIPHLLKKDQQDQRDRGAATGVADSAKRRLSYVENMREGFRYTSQSTYLRWMAAGALLLMMLMALIEYRSSDLLAARFVEDELTDFLVMLSSLGNIIVLPLLLFVVSRLITRLGLGNASMVFPIINLATCGGLIYAPGWISASAAYLDRKAFRLGIQRPIDGLLYNAVPLRVKGRARAFVGGLVEPVGSLIGGLLLLLPLVSTSWFVPGLVGVLAVAYLASTWFIRRQYGKALVEMLEQEDYSFLLSQEASDLTAADPATLVRLQQKLEESTSHEITVFMAKLISQVGGDRAASILASAARSEETPRTRAAIVDVIAASGLRGGTVYQLYNDLLADSDGQVRQSAIAGLEGVDGAGDSQFLAQMLEMTKDPDVAVRVRALSALVHSGNFRQLSQAIQVLDHLLSDEDPERRACGVRLLGQIGDGAAVHSLIESLGDAADQVRLEAAVAVEQLSQGSLPEQANGLLVDKMRLLLQDPIERARQAALVVLGRVGTAKSHALLVDALTDPSPQIRQTAVDALAGVGKSIVPVVHPKLDSSNSQLRKMAAVVLSRVDSREFGGLILGSTVTGNLLTIYRNYGLVEALAPCDAYPSVGVLQSTLLEENWRLLDEVFYLLTAIHEPDDVEIVKESLRSENARVRANAREALEALTTPQMDDLIAPLFEPEMSRDQLLSISRDVWNMEHPDTAGAMRQLVTNPDAAWLRAVTSFVLGEMGASLTPQPVADVSDVADVIDVADDADKPRRINPLDMLTSKLMDKDSAGEAGQERKLRRSPGDLLDALVGDSGKDVAKDDDTGASQTSEEKGMAREPAAAQAPFSLAEIEQMLEAALSDAADEVRFAAQAAKRVMAGFRITGVTMKEEIVLSSIEKIIFLKEVPFFENMTIDQLKVLANVCEEEFFEADTRIYDQGDSGGALYVVVNGRVGVEQEKRTGSFARLADIEAHSYFGEMNLFDNSPRTTSAIAVKDTLTLRLRREPLIVLARQHPDLSLELINVLSQRLRESNDRIANLTRTRPRELHKLFDKFD